MRGERRDGNVNPAQLYPERADQLDYFRNEHRLHRQQDPARQRALKQAVEQQTSSPDDQAEVLAAIAQLTHQGQEVLPADVPALVAAVQEGHDPMQAITASSQRRARRAEPVPSAEAEQGEYMYTETPRRRPERPPFVGREQRVEDAIVAADLRPEQEATRRRVVKMLSNQGPYTWRHRSASRSSMRCAKLSRGGMG
jgi:hypothetical protein